MLINLRSIQIAGLLCLLASCRAPMSYVNSVPTSSLLEEKGDFNVQAGLGADYTFSDKTFDVAANWALAEQCGITWQTTFLHKDGYDKTFFDDLYSWNFGLVYYQKKSSVEGFELKLTYGQGHLQGEDEFSQSFYWNPDKLRIKTDFSRFNLQPSYNYYPQDSPNARITTGIRLSYIQFDSYFFESNRHGLYSDSFGIVSFDPFLQTIVFLGPFGVNTGFAYSFRSVQRVFAQHKHPNYKKFAFTVGILIHLDRD